MVGVEPRSRAKGCRKTRPKVMRVSPVKSERKNPSAAMRRALPDVYKRQESAFLLEAQLATADLTLLFPLPHLADAHAKSKTIV